MRTESIPIHSLPNELTLAIVNRLQPKDILRFSMVRYRLQSPALLLLLFAGHSSDLNPKHEQTCKRIHNLITTSSILQYHLDLFAFGLADNEYSNRSHRTIADRRKRLRELQASWRTLSWKRTIELAYFNSDIDDDLPKLYQGVIICPASESNPVGYHLPTHAEPEHSRAIHISVTDNNINAYGREYALDPTQDLFAFFTVHDGDTPNARIGRIHLCSLSLSPIANGVGNEWATHPDVAVAFLECEEDTDRLSGFDPWEPDDPSIFVVDDVLVYWMVPGQHLVVWKWQSGAKVLVRVVCTSAA